MNALTEGTGSKVCWFVGASYGGTNDQTDRFVDKGVWENGYGNKYLDLVQSIKPGDRIAIKSSYTRKHNLPFDNRGHVASVMAIKAIGIVTKNHGDGRIVEVDWTKLEEPREWYFYTYRKAVRCNRRASIGVAVLRRMLASNHSAYYAIANTPYAG